MVCLFYKVSKPTNILSKILLQKKALQIFLCFAFLANIFFKFFFIKVALLKDSTAQAGLGFYVATVTKLMGLINNAKRILVEQEKEEEKLRNSRKLPNFLLY